MQKNNMKFSGQMGRKGLETEPMKNKYHNRERECVYVSNTLMVTVANVLTILYYGTLLCGMLFEL